MHTAAFRAAGLAAVYAAIRTGPDAVPLLMRALAEAGGGGNVTIPHKQTAAVAADELRGAGRTLRTSNTFWAEDGRLIGDNTDVAGVQAAVHELAVAGGPWLIVGTGGSARAVAAAAGERGVAIAVRSRSDVAARSFLEWATGIGVAPAEEAACVLAVNATPLGLGDDRHPLRLEELPAAAAVLDLVYRAGETAWVRAARARGLRAADGRGVLVAQGAAALSRWYPGLRPPIAAMRSAVDAALG
jgi:shikimate dehydrogenase